MRFLLDVSCGVEDVDAPQEAVVDINKELAELLLKRRAAFQALAAYDRDAWEIYFWSSTCQFVGGRGDAESRGGETPVEESVLEQLGQEDYDLTGREWLLVPEEATVRFVEARTECDQLIVSEKGVRFMAYPKHCDWEIRTGEIPWEEIEKAARGAPEAEESDETEVDHGLGPVLIEEDTAVWDITFEPEIEIPVDQDNNLTTVQDYWSNTLSQNDDRVIDWGHIKEAEEIARERWKAHIRALVRVDDAQAWIKEVQFGSTWMARLTVVNAPVRRVIKAGYREGEMFAPEVRAGFEFNDALHVFCIRCLDTVDRERVTNQHALTEGEKFTCDKCGGSFVAPPEEDETT